MVFNDSVHKHIDLHPLCVKIVDTVEFQRLRFIKQLGGAYYIFPGASHNRFEHSLGVCHLAGEFLRSLKRRQPEDLQHVTDKDILCVEIAGLCHDLGHGPFSHLFDGNFISAMNRKRRADQGQGYKDVQWQHEMGSLDMFDFMFEKNKLREHFVKAGLSEDDLIFIKECIHCQQIDGKAEVKGRPQKNQRFLYEIVSNKRSGIDVDKWDYFARDCKYLGIEANNFDISRYMRCCKVLADPDGCSTICVRDKEVRILYDLFTTRLALHARAYQHKTTKIIEQMIVEALVLANDHIKRIGKDNRPVTLFEAINDMRAFSQFDDTVFNEILYSPLEELKPARDLLRQIQERRLYKCVGEVLIEPGIGKITETDSVLKEIFEGVGFDLKAEDLALQVVWRDFGMKDKNPVDCVLFYSKNDEKPKQISREEVSHMLPKVFNEQKLRLICRNLDASVMTSAAEAFAKWTSTSEMCVTVLRFS